MGHIKSANEVPKEPHYAIIVFSSETYRTEGDERSRTNPGHGYPAETHTVTKQSYHAFPLDAKVEFDRAIKFFFGKNPNRTDILVLKVEPLKVKTETTIVVE